MRPSPHYQKVFKMEVQATPPSVAAPVPLDGRGMPMDPNIAPPVNNAPPEGASRYARMKWHLTRRSWWHFRYV